MLFLGEIKDGLLEGMDLGGFLLDLSLFLIELSGVLLLLELHCGLE